LIFNVLAIAESVEPVISMEINIWRRGSIVAVDGGHDRHGGVPHGLEEPLQCLDK
jgi:hypothetical protein